MGCPVKNPCGKGIQHRFFEAADAAELPVQAGVIPHGGHYTRRPLAGLLPMNSMAVALPGWLMPSRRSTLSGVSSRILRSSQNDQWSTYQVSKENLSSQVTLLRPLICAQP